MKRPVDPEDISLMTTFENQSQLARDQANVVSNCWSEGSYELGVEALNAFRTADKRYPSPSHIRHLLALALYPPERPHIAQPQPHPTTPPKKSGVGAARSRPHNAAPLSPRKLQAQTEIPSPDASQLALELLTTLASTTHPAHLTAGLNSYARPACDAKAFDEMLASGMVDTFKSPLIVESVRVGQARDCWTMLRDGVVVRKDAGGPSTAQAKREEDDDDDTDLGLAGHPSCVASHAWGVAEWWISLFEVDERVNAIEQGSATPSKLFLSHLRPASQPGAPRWDVQAPLDVVCCAHRHPSQPPKLPELSSRLLRLLINASATFAVSPGILVRAMTDRLQTLTSSAFKQMVLPLPKNEPSAADFPLYLYSRFFFCLAALYLARTGGDVSETAVFGGAADPSSGRGPKARPKTTVMSESQTSDSASSKPMESYPYPTPSLQTTLTLLRSTPTTTSLNQASLAEALCMHAIARWTILRSLVVEMGCRPTETWISVNDLPGWNTGVIQSVRIGFEADVGAGAESLDGCQLWKDARGWCETLCEYSS